MDWLWFLILAVNFGLALYAIILCWQLRLEPQFTGEINYTWPDYDTIALYAQTVARSHPYEPPQWHDSIPTEFLEQSESLCLSCGSRRSS